MAAAVDIEDIAEEVDVLIWASEASKRSALLALRASNVCPNNKTHVAHRILAPFASHLYELATLLKEVQREAEIRGAHFSPGGMKDIESQIRRAEQLVDDFSGRSSLYLLMCFPDLVKHLKPLYTSLRTVLESFFLTDGGWSSYLKVRFADEMHALQQSGSAKLGPKEQSLHDSLEQGVLDSIVADATLAMKLTRQIAESLGFSSLDSEEFRNEISKLKMEKDGAERRRGMAHALYLQQFINLLVKAMDAATSSSVGLPHVGQGERAHLVQSSGSCGGAPPAARDTLVLPLQSFICLITRDVMNDPVQIASGQTFERMAIERWFAEGHTSCPTGVELANTNMKSNIALKQSIVEWKERNNTIRLDVATDMLVYGPEVQQLRSLQDLQALCQEESLYKYKVASKSLVPLLVHLAESSNLELRLNAFSLLGSLAENEECQEIMVNEKVIETVVRCLARQNDEVAVCVRLMRILSSNQEIAEKISGVPSAVLFLVTSIQDEQCVDNVKAILENLPKSDENVVIMAEANIMQPLVLRLNQGKSASKILMAKTLGRLQMLDSSKIVAATGETMKTLACMAESAREEERDIAVIALENLSCVAAARHGLVEAGALGTLLQVMKGMRNSDAAKRGSAVILANMWAADDCAFSDTFLEEAVGTFFQLLGPPTPVQVQAPMMQGLLGLVRGSSDLARTAMKDNGAFSCLLRLFLSFNESKDSAMLRCPCLELLACLASIFQDEAAEAMRSHPAALPVLASLIKLENWSEPELLAATSFVACLPSSDLEITKQMLVEPELLQSLASLLKNHRNEAVVDAAAGALLRFTSPDDRALQSILAKAGVIPAFVGLLRSGGVVAREKAGRALCNFSKSSWELSLSAQEARQALRANSLWACFSQRQRWNRSILCRVHGGKCSLQGTFCLVEADAVVPLAEVLREVEGGSSCVAASLMALATLMEGGNGEAGCTAIEQAGGWNPIIGLMGSRTLQVQEIAAQLSEILLSFPHYRKQYASKAQMHIITLAQRGTPALKRLAGRLLHHLELLHSQSSYFGVASLTTS